MFNKSSQLTLFFIIFRTLSCYICRTVVLQHHPKGQYIIYYYIIIEGKNNDTATIYRLCFKTKNSIHTNRIGFSIKQIQITNQGNTISAKKLSSKDIEVHIHTLISCNGPKIKYQNPTGWRANSYYRYT